MWTVWRESQEETDTVVSEIPAIDHINNYRAPD